MPLPLVRLADLMPNPNGVKSAGGYPKTILESSTAPREILPDGDPISRRVGRSDQEQASP